MLRGPKRDKVMLSMFQQGFFLTAKAGLARAAAASGGGRALLAQAGCNQDVQKTFDGRRPGEREPGQTGKIIRVVVPGAVNYRADIAFNTVNVTACLLGDRLVKVLLGALKTILVFNTKLNREDNHFVPFQAVSDAHMP